MLLTIIQNEKTTLPFKSFAIGEILRHNGKLYIKLNEITISGEIYNAVCLDGYYIEAMPDNAQCEDITGIMKVES